MTYLLALLLLFTLPLFWCQDANLHRILTPFTSRLLAMFAGVKNKTSVKKGDLNPEWDEKLEWELTGKAPSPDEKLELLIKDHDTVGRNKYGGLGEIVEVWWISLRESGSLRDCLDPRYLAILLVVKPIYLI